MQVKFWGVRGSIPTPGAKTQRWGGNSSCLEVVAPGHQPLVLDCGTGARPLGLDLVSREDRSLDIVFSHLHMDHLFGFPFFSPLYLPKYTVRVTVPAYTDEEAESKVAQYLNGLYHPTRLAKIPAKLEFRGVRPGQVFEASGYEMEGLALNHPGGSVGYRVQNNDGTIAYITDTAPFAKPDEGIHVGKAPTAAEERVVRFLEGCDVVVYDTMFSHAEYLENMTWGHSYPEYAHSICRAAGVRELVLFHHLPDASDEQLDTQKSTWSVVTDPVVSLACEEETVFVEG